MGNIKMKNHDIQYQWHFTNRNNKMCRAVLLLSLLVFVVQYADSTAIPEDKQIKDLNVYDNARSIKDTWENVKASIQAAWNAVKNIAHITKEKIEKWREDLKKRAEELAKEFEKRVEKIKQKMKETLQKLIETGEQLKKCVKDEDKVLDGILKEILKATLHCVSDNITKLSAIDNHQVYLRNAIEDTEYINQIEKKLKTCAKDDETALECFDAVRKDAFDNTETLERDILNRRANARSILDDILDNIVACTTQGIVESSTSIADEAVKILECVKQS